MMFNRLGDLLAEDRYHFPQGAACQICEWGGDTPDTSGSQQQILQGQAQGLAALQAGRDQARADVAPWRSLGTTAANTMGGLWNLPGYAQVDPTALLTSTPGYQFLRDQGMQSLARYGAATGMGMSGPAMKSAQNFGQNLAQTYAWNPYISGLSSMSNQGLQAGGMSGNWSMQTGMGEANLYNNTANQLAQLQMQQEMMNQANSPWNDIMGGVGFLGSMALAPFTGGMSLAGIPGSLSTLFSGGGGGMATGSSGNAFSSTLPSSIAGFMAEGGPTEANKPYIIGERGPELFVSDRPGFIIPNHLMKYSSMSEWKKAA